MYKTTKTLLWYILHFQQEKQEICFQILTFFSKKIIFFLFSGFYSLFNKTLPTLKNIKFGLFQLDFIYLKMFYQLKTLDYID